MDDYQPINIEDAKQGDEVFHAGQWCAIDRLIITGKTINITWTAGGTHTGPVHFFGKARRATSQEETP